MLSQNRQNTVSNPPAVSDDNLFDDDFEQAVDLEAVTALERRSQETVKVVQDRFESTRGRGQMIEEETGEIMEEFLEDINFEPLEDW